MQNSCICFLNKAAERFPNKVAVIDDSKSYTFSELKENALRLSQFIDVDISKAPVAILLNKSADSILSFLAVMFSDNFYIPLDVHSPLERIGKIFQTINPKIVITSDKFEHLVPDGYSEGVVLNIDSFFDKNANEATETGADRSISTIDTDPVYCIFTSGSTGTPKGVTIPHRAIIDMAEWAAECFKVTSDSVIGNQAPFFFDLSTIDIYLMLKTGATLHVIPQYLYSFPARLIDYLEKNEINFICWVPSALTHVANQDALNDRDLPFLKKVFFIGEVMPTKTYNYWKERIKKAQYCNMYGPSETTFCSTYYVIDKVFEDHEPLPIGFPCRNTDIIILNSDDRLCSSDEVGELCIRGSSLALGYWNEPDKTESAFVLNPLATAYPERIYRTGDLVKFDEAVGLIFCGRKDNQIKHSGYRVELGEIENIASSLDLVDQVCVLYDKETSTILLLYVTTSNDINKKSIFLQLAKLLPKYMLPNKIIRLDSMPLNPNGKVDRVQLSKNINSWVNN